MANVFKAKEAYKKTPAKIDPNKPFVAVHGLYIAGMWRPPYWIDVTLNMTKIGGSQAADVVYYTEASDTGHVEPEGILSVVSITMDEPVLVEYTSISDNGYVETEGILDILSITMGEPDIVFYDQYTDTGYVEPDGILNVVEITMGQPTLYQYSIKDGEQSPGQPILNIKTHGTTSATIT